MLQRAQGAGLVANFDLSTVMPTVVSEVLGQAHRLEHLALTRSVHYSTTWEEYFSQWGTLHVPRLRNLCLANLDCNPTYPLLPERLFRGAVNLRHLGLLEIDINWDSHLLNALTTLALNKISRKPTWSQLRSMLQRMPELQSLAILNTLPSKTPEATSTTSPVHLPLLKMLHIDDGAVKCKSFLDIVSLSDCLETCECRAGFVLGQETALEVHDLLSSADRIASGKRLSASAQSLIIDGAISNEESLKLSFLTANGLVNTSAQDHIVDFIVNKPPGLRFSIWEKRIRYTGDRQKLYNDVFVGMFHALHFQTLLELDLSTLCAFSWPIRKFSDTLAATFGTLPMLHSITVGRRTAPLLVDILSVGLDKHGDCDMADNSDTPSSGGSDETADSDKGVEPNPMRPSLLLPFPALRNLKLYGIRSPGDEGELKMGNLKKCLINRNGLGVGISKLVFEDCKKLVVDDVEELKDLVLRVDCIGNTTYR
ncbi:hypothetical protein D9619_003536 [Psilocybe cf. subviscida]|uniref:F-box domain-containing protein n=1 Tax=Psilocybe cf. subviscida TaxID=2480587 RepID=A0A8H5EUN9_9AGAR|nr:hypothetical protein D9619_003536 [Psilocybe cf. subviscida]